MGYARSHSSGDKRSWFTLRKNTPKGAPVPGTGVRHRHKHRSGSNKSGSLSKLNLEWSASDRKQEDDQRGINNRARAQNIAEALEEIEAEKIENAPYQYSVRMPEEGWADHLARYTTVDGTTYVYIEPEVRDWLAVADTAEMCWDDNN